MVISLPVNQGAGGMLCVLSPHITSLYPTDFHGVNSGLKLLRQDVGRKNYITWFLAVGVAQKTHKIAHLYDCYREYIFLLFSSLSRGLYLVCPPLVWVVAGYPHHIKATIF